MSSILSSIRHYGRLLGWARDLSLTVTAVVLAACTPMAAAPTTSATDLPAYFNAWPAMVATWQGTPSGAASETSGGLSSVDQLASACPPRGMCEMQVAWDGHGGWSLSVSAPGAAQTPRAAIVAWGEIRYIVVQGVVTQVGDAVPGMPIPVCDQALRAARSGALSAAQAPSATPDSTNEWVFQSPSGTSVRCRQDSGLPTQFASNGREWKLVEQQLRSPTPQEQGMGIARPKVNNLPLTDCSSSGTLITSSPAGAWLEQLLRHSAYDYTSAGSGFQFRFQGREFFTWVSSDDPVLVPEGVRLRGGVAGMGNTQLAETLHPLVSASFPADGLRIWVAMTYGDTDYTHHVQLERQLRTTETIAANLYTESVFQPYSGPPPQGNGFLHVADYAQYTDLDVPRLLAFAPALAAATTPESTRLAASDWWAIGWSLSRIPQMSGVSQTPAMFGLDTPYREARVLAGGGMFIIRPRSPDTTNQTLLSAAKQVAAAANQCPWLGMPLQSP